MPVKLFQKITQKTAEATGYLIKNKTTDQIKNISKHKLRETST